MDPVFNFPAFPGTPLFPVSPERANRQPLPQSPSLPSNLIDPFVGGQMRAPSDVQSKVAKFNDLSKEAAQRRRDHEAALKRAILGREEAESETRRLKEQNSGLEKELEEGRGRERRVGERLDALMEELRQTKESNARSQAVYEKEIRRARKEAFKSSSSLVKLQEDLKTARNRFTLMREEAEAQRRKAESRDQEVFAAQYQGIGLQEELEKVKLLLKTLEDERDALKTSLREEEVARIAAEGKIPLPISQEQDDFSSPEKEKLRKSSPKTRRGSFKENLDPLSPSDFEEDSEEAELRAELKWEKKMRMRCEERIDFMNIECQFKRCSCRLAEYKGYNFIHDTGDKGIKDIASRQPTIEIFSKENALEPDRSGIEHGNLEDFSLEKPTPGQISKVVPPPTSLILRLACKPNNSPSNKENPNTPEEQLPNANIFFSPSSGTFFKAPAVPQSSSLKRTSPSNFDIPQTPTALLRFSPQFPSIPHQSTAPEDSPLELTVSQPHLTTSKPLPAPATNTTCMAPTKATAGNIPPAVLPGPLSHDPTISREEALEQIRQRRGRARSIAAGHGTPRKQLIDWSNLRRDISAPARNP